MAATATTHCIHAGADAEPQICPSCAATKRCEVCQGPSYRISLVSGTVEELDHRECRLIESAA